MSISLRAVTKQFGEFAAIRNIDLEVPTGTLMALLGPSGGGKTTLLRIIAGLETPDQGQVLFDGEDATLWPIGKRKVGFVFQHYALFRHMTVFENVLAFGLQVESCRRERPSAEAIRKSPGPVGFGAAELVARAFSRAAIRRPATAGGLGARHGRGSAGAAAG